MLDGPDTSLTVTLLFEIPLGLPFLNDLAPLLIVRTDGLGSLLS